MNDFDMQERQYIFDATAENFAELVITNSEKGPVLVNYWTPQAGPCLKLWSVLESLSNEYAGRFLLANINVDKQTSLVREQGITSVPTVKIYSRGEVLESIHGAQSEAALRGVIEKYINPAQDSVLARAIHAYQQGEVGEALQILDAERVNNPNERQLVQLYLKILIREKRYTEVENIIHSVPEQLRTDPELVVLRTHAGFLENALHASPQEILEKKIVQNAEDLESRYKLAALFLTQDAYDSALQQLLEIFRRDRAYRDDVGRRGMVTVFHLLGKDHELTRKYQACMRDFL